MQPIDLFAPVRQWLEGHDVIYAVQVALSINAGDVALDCVHVLVFVLCHGRQHSYVPKCTEVPKCTDSIHKCPRAPRSAEVHILQEGTCAQGNLPGQEICKMENAELQEEMRIAASVRSHRPAIFRDDPSGGPPEVPTVPCAANSQSCTEVSTWRPPMGPQMSAMWAAAQRGVQMAQEEGFTRQDPSGNWFCLLCDRSFDDYSVETHCGSKVHLKLKERKSYEDDLKRKKKQRACWMSGLRSRTEWSIASCALRTRTSSTSIRTGIERGSRGSKSRICSM